MNKKTVSKILLSLFGVVIIAFCLPSCTSYKKITYLTDIPSALDHVPVQVVASGTDSFQSIRIQPNDLVQVSIHTLDPQVNAIFNQTSEGIAANGLNSGILVDKDGDIVLPVIGKVKIGGLTTAEARELINQKANIYLKEPIVNIRIANFKITVIGEVNKPSQIIVPDEKVNVIEAIGLAGDLTVFGKRQNMLLIRHDSSDQKKYIRLDLTSAEFTNSRYFYLKQGDILYVEPIKLKSTLQNPLARNVIILTSAVSLTALIVNLIKK